MPSSRLLALALAGFVGTFAFDVSAHAQAKGFAVERLYPSAPGGGWVVMDDLDLHGRLGGDLQLTLGYAANPLRVTDGVHRLAVISDQAFADVGAALTWDRWRVYVNFAMPLAVYGQSGTVGNYSFGGPALDLGSDPDVISDVRLGADVRLLGRPGGPIRLGVGAQLFVPFGDRADYVTDGTFRGMIRAFLAGNAPYFVWAAQLGVHVRPLDDAPAPGSPRGSELLFGAAAGARLRLPRDWSAIFGPELFGATTFRAFLHEEGTALEGLLTARFEGTRGDRMQLRVKIGAGGALNHHFGAAEWRIVAGIEVFNHRDR